MAVPTWPLDSSRRPHVADRGVQPRVPSSGVKR
jgi:hypothetical protein